jgi:hypothetical protein
MFAVRTVYGRCIAEVDDVAELAIIDCSNKYEATLVKKNISCE